LPTRRFLSALACFSSSLLVAAGGAAAGAQESGGAERPRADAVRLELAELEAGLARKPDVYLVLEPDAHKLAIKARGLELDSIALEEVVRLEFHPLFGVAQAPPLEAPAVWTIRQGPGDTDRETIAPTTLRPYSEEEEKQEPATTGTEPESKPPGDEPKPSSFRFTLDNGWQILLVNERPRLGWFRRFGSAVRDGWLRLRGREPSHPPLIALVVSPDDARKLHHLFRAGMKILVAPSGGSATEM
jgi:hypothetical protein